MELGLLRIFGVFFVGKFFDEMFLLDSDCPFVFTAAADVGFAIYGRYTQEELAPTSYVAHFAGALAGLTLGLLVLKNFEQCLHKQLIWKVSLFTYLFCMVYAISYNIGFNNGYNDGFNCRR